MLCSQVWPIWLNASHSCRGFRHEKTKKKRGSYKGGIIDNASHSIKFENSDDEWQMTSDVLDFLITGNTKNIAGDLWESLVVVWLLFSEELSRKFLIKILVIFKWDVPPLLKPYSVGTCLWKFWHVQNIHSVCLMCSAHWWKLEWLSVVYIFLRDLVMLRFHWPLSDSAVEIQRHYLLYASDSDTCTVHKTDWEKVPNNDFGTYHGSTFWMTGSSSGCGHWINLFFKGPSKVLLAWFLHKQRQSTELSERIVLLYHMFQAFSFEDCGADQAFLLRA
jgi:hypothetical protein